MISINMISARRAEHLRMLRWVRALGVATSVAAAARIRASSSGLVTMGQWPESMSTNSRCLAFVSSGRSPSSIHS